MKIPLLASSEKILPVLITESHEAIGESLDIVNYIDGFCSSYVLTQTENPVIYTGMEEAATMINRLVIPRWAVSGFEEFHQKRRGSTSSTI